MFERLLTRIRLLVAPMNHREVDEELEFHLERQVEYVCGGCFSVDRGCADGNTCSGAVGIMGHPI
jgi:hypothetical protein